MSVIYFVCGAPLRNSHAHPLSPDGLYCSFMIDLMMMISPELMLATEKDRRQSHQPTIDILYLFEVFSSEEMQFQGIPVARGVHLVKE